MNLARRILKTGFKNLFKDFCGAFSFLFFFIGKKKRIVIIDLIPAHSQFSKLLLEGWEREDILLIKSYERREDELNFKNEIRVLKLRLLSFFYADLVITFASHIKKIKLPNKAQIIHLPHSLVSLHGIYTKYAFKDIDHFFASGPHHVNEFKKLKKKYGWQDKTIHEVGYHKIDYIKKLVKKKSSNKNKTVIIAPSWGINNLLVRAGKEMINSLLNDTWDIILRPHPLIKREHPRLYASFKKMEKETPDRLLVEGESPGLESLVKADIMISDWSGVAYEFAFGLKRPVLFIDGPQKRVTDRENDLPDIDFPYMEVEARKKVGRVCAIEDFIEVLNNIFEEQELWQKKIKQAQKKYVFNVGLSVEVARIKVEEIISDIKLH